MKNIVGQTPRGSDFYPRNTIIRRIYRRLESGNNLYLAAPRRSGKTSIMRALEDQPHEGFMFSYINVEDCSTFEDYFKLLSDELEKIAIGGKLAILGEKAKSLFGNFLEKVKKIKIAGFEIETTNSSKLPGYAAAFEELLIKLDSENVTIVIMVDEFPVAVENIAKAHGNDEALGFLHANRGMRQRAGKGIRFIYTGSIGLPNVARKLGPAPTINDLNIVEIPPLTQEEGLDMSLKIFQAYDVPINESDIFYMLEKINWLMPFFIQLVIQLLIDETESEGIPITAAMVDKVLLKAANHRNNIYFASYYDRLEKTLPVDQCEIAKGILAEIAEKEAVESMTFKNENVQVILETLEYDGYIHEQSGFYHFNSPILRMWWSKNAR